jgi:hypothetical protein
VEFIVTNKNGRSFLVRLVAKGDRYGFNDCLVHEKEGDLVEFYDQTYKDQNGFGHRGQFVSRYYVLTLINHTGGLDLHGGIAEWKVDAEAMTKVLDVLFPTPKGRVITNTEIAISEQLIQRAIGIVAKLPKDDQVPAAAHAFALLFWNLPGFRASDFHDRCKVARARRKTQDEVNRGA